MNLDRRSRAAPARGVWGPGLRRRRRRRELTDSMLAILTANISISRRTEKRARSSAARVHSGLRRQRIWSAADPTDRDQPAMRGAGGSNRRQLRQDHHEAPVLKPARSMARPLIAGPHATCIAHRGPRHVTQRRCRWPTPSSANQPEKQRRFEPDDQFDGARRNRTTGAGPSHVETAPHVVDPARRRSDVDKHRRHQPAGESSGPCLVCDTTLNQAAHASQDERSRPGPRRRCWPTSLTPTPVPRTASPSVPGGPPARPSRGNSRRDQREELGSRRRAGNAPPSRPP